MHVTPLVWGVTLAILLAILLVDILVLGRRPHEPSVKESSLAIGAYTTMAVLFGLGVWFVHGGRYAGEFFAGWLTEYSLSIDNLFIFLLIMAAMKVPRHLQNYGLMVGIVLALIFRFVFIMVGAAALERFSWVFFIFGAWLIYTAVKLFIDYAQDGDDDEEATDAWLMRYLKKAIPSTPEWDGTKSFSRATGKRLATPMFFLIVALGSTDLMFALDSIPAIFGLTQEPYLVFAANVFALMGLRQLYFLLGNMLKRLVYLSLGLAVILAFIGAKLIIHAGHEAGWWTLEVTTGVSLAVIIGTLAITTIASLLKTRNMPVEELDTPVPVADADPEGDPTLTRELR